jgi:DNA-binding IclR family transcriptional regulator
MGRHTDQERLHEIARYVERHPGVRPAEIARGLELPRSSVTRALPSLEDQGCLLYEDGRGRLWPFDARNGR